MIELSYDERMNDMDLQETLKIVTDIFDIKCKNLKSRRNPNIFLKGNKELFSEWFKHSLGSYEIKELGANDHPDLIFNANENKIGVGIELKSLKTNGQIQFNSTIPCGGFNHKGYSGECYYAIARYAEDREYGYLEDFTICDGDFFNTNREWAFSHKNDQEKEFGDFSDGVCRYRKMYSFPSPLKDVPGVSIISKFDYISDVNSNLVLDGEIEKIDNIGVTHTFYIYRHKLIM